MSSKQSFKISQVGRGVLLALAATASMMPALAQEAPAKPAEKEQDVERIEVSGRLMSSAASAAGGSMDVGTGVGSGWGTGVVAGRRGAVAAER